MKVILKDYVYKHGVAGDVVNVADGFARNFLFPRGLAVKATPGAVRENQQLIVQAAKNREHLRAMESEAAAKIDGVELVFGVKAGKNNKLYGSITTSDIARALQEKTGEDINRRRISERSLRELGLHEVPVRLGHEISPVLRIVILREDEVAPYLEGKPVATLIEQQQRQMEVVEVEAEEEDEQEIEQEAELASGEPAVAEEEAE